MEIVVREVTTRRELKKFIKFPNKLFRNVPTYIPPLMMDELGLLTSKNPSLDHCNLKMWLAICFYNNMVKAQYFYIRYILCNDKWR